MKKNRRILKVGNSFGVVLTKNDLANIDAKQGDFIQAKKVAGGILLIKADKVMQVTN